ncbi:hypothetical protein, partial [Rossellomorea vietnamensis]
MTLVNLQTMISSFFRDENVRNEVQIKQDRVFERFCLTSDEIKLARKIDFLSLEKGALNTTKERLGKRRADYQELFIILETLERDDEVLSSFVKKEVSGTLGRKLDSERFFEFFKYYVLDEDLPEVLIEIAEYSSIMSNLSYANEVDILNEESLNLNKPIYLKEPFELKTFNYDLGPLIESDFKIDNIKDLEALQKSETKIFFQKEY